MGAPCPTVLFHERIYIFAAAAVRLRQVRELRVFPQAERPNQIGGSPNQPGISANQIAKVTAVGFEPTPLRTGALSQRLRPLGQTVIWEMGNHWRLNIRADRARPVQEYLDDVNAVKVSQWSYIRVCPGSFGDAVMAFSIAVYIV